MSSSCPTVSLRSKHLQFSLSKRHNCPQTRLCFYRMNRLIHKLALKPMGGVKTPRCIALPGLSSSKVQDLMTRLPSCQALQPAHGSLPRSWVAEWQLWGVGVQAGRGRPGHCAVTCCRCPLPAVLQLGACMHGSSCDLSLPFLTCH